MEVTCSRCHQAIPVDSCFCPTCGLPQLVYASEGDNLAVASERWPESARDSSSINWKAGMRAVVSLAVPAGLLSSGISPLSALGVFWVSGAAVWAVVLYTRNQRPAWITTGAGARIGLVTGLIAGWLAFGVSGARLFIERVVLHQPAQIDSVYKAFSDAFEQKMHESIATMSATDAAQVQASLSQVQGWILSPEGHAAIWSFGLAFNCLMLLIFAVCGGALGARFLSRSRRSGT
jgi:hypothetical protein